MVDADQGFDRPLALGIETSCDDTAAAVVDARGRVLSSVVSSQLAAHRPWGGVVPEIASREHLTNWPSVLEATLRPLGLAVDDLDLFAATSGPGLIGSLLVGLSLGRSLAWGLERPFFAVHHLEGHLYSPLLATEGRVADAIPERFVGLVVSGGHTSLYAVDRGRVETLGETRDDAMGEVFDKVGKRLDLPYPGGPEVDRLAELGEAQASPAPVTRLEGLDFSFSGLKSRTLRELEKMERAGIPRRDDAGEPSRATLDLLAGFRRAAVAQILDRLQVLHAESPLGTLLVSGGAAANRLLRRDLTTWSAEAGVDLRLVPLRFSGDNAAMIAWVAQLRAARGERDDPLAVAAQSRLPLRGAI